MQILQTGNASLTNYASGLLQIGYKSEKWQWPNMASLSNIFWRCFVSFVKFSYWSKFQVNIITGSGVITIFFYKGLTRNLGIGNALVGVLPNIWRVRSTKFGTNAFNEMLLNAVKGQAFTVSELLQENQLGPGGGG